MSTLSVVCVACGAKFEDQWWLCPECSGSLEVRGKLRDKAARYRELSLGESDTPLVRLNRLSRRLGCDLWAKCEFANPTGSFKDRGSIIEVDIALELGKQGVVCASTGNMAASLSAYAGRAGLACKVVVPDATPDSKLKQALACGAKLVRVSGGYNECVAIAERIAEQENYFLCGDYALRREGQQSIGRELTGQNFDAFIVPVGNGTVGIAIAQGLAEVGASKSPRFIGVQAEEVNPIEEAWRIKRGIQANDAGATVASAMNVRIPLDGDMTLAWVAKTGGLLTTVTDTEIEAAREMLAQSEGLYVERTAAAGLAMLVRDSEQYIGQKLVIILTGSGLKDN